MNNHEGTVYVVDDDPSVLKAVARLLVATGFRVHTFPSARAFLDQQDLASPSCMVLDVAMPEITGPELQDALIARGLEPMIVFLTGRGDIPVGIRAMRAGAVHFLTKPVGENDLLAAVREALMRDVEAQRVRKETLSARERLAKLTSREREVFELVVAGRLNKQIAAELGTVEKTIKVHRARVMSKMGARSLAELVRIADRCGIRAPEA